MKFVLVALLFGACLTVTWPTASSTKTLSSPMTIKAGQTYDGKASNSGKWIRFERGKSGLGDCTSVEGGKADAVFLLEKGATLKNVILGAKSIEHVHCEGDGCTVENVYWEDVCEDALTFENGTSTGAKFYVKGGAAKNGSDLAGYNSNYGDTVTLKNVKVSGGGHVCRAFQGRNDGKEPTAIGYKCEASGTISSCVCS